LCSRGGVYIHVFLLLPRHRTESVIAFLHGVCEKFALKLSLEFVLLMIMCALKFLPFHDRQIANPL
jgi:hypothetical protein